MRKKKGKFTFWMIGTPNADTERLRELTFDGNFIALKCIGFGELFDRLTFLMRQASRLRTDAEISLHTDRLTN